MKWNQLKLGDIVKCQKDSSFPCDLLLISAPEDIIFVDTMQLDGETNLKPKVVSNEKIHENMVRSVDGRIQCDNPNASLEEWDALVHFDNPKEDQVMPCKINNLLLRGCYLRNIDCCYGVVVYMGQKSKIMMNAKKPPRKVSNMMKMMNYMLYTVFAFQLTIIVVYATLSAVWKKGKGENYEYLNMDEGQNLIVTWIIQFLTYWVAYSHMIPISLYVIIEILKLVQAKLIGWDELMKDEELNQHAECRNSDLTEEMGQVEFVFSDKTGTLTQNKMEFKKCSVTGVVFQDSDDPPKQGGPDDTMNIIDIKNWKTSTKNALSSGPMINETDQGLIDFFTFMAVCHSVVVDKDPNHMDKDDPTNVKYQASSPDELALVNGSKDAGITLMERTKTDVIIRIEGN